MIAQTLAYLQRYQSLCLPFFNITILWVITTAVLSKDFPACSLKRLHKVLFRCKLPELVLLLLPYHSLLVNHRFRVAHSPICLLAATSDHEHRQHFDCSVCLSRLRAALQQLPQMFCTAVTPWRFRKRMGDGADSSCCPQVFTVAASC